MQAGSQKEERLWNDRVLVPFRKGIPWIETQAGMLCLFREIKWGVLKMNNCFKHKQTSSADSSGGRPPSSSPAFGIVSECSPKVSGSIVNLVRFQEPNNAWNARRSVTMVNRNRYVGFCSHSFQQERSPLNIKQIPVLRAHPSCVKMDGILFHYIYTHKSLLGANPILLVGTSVPFNSNNQLIQPCEGIPLCTRS